MTAQVVDIHTGRPLAVEEPPDDVWSVDELTPAQRAGHDARVQAWLARMAEPIDWSPLERFANECRAAGVEATSVRTGMSPDLVRELIAAFATTPQRRHLHVAP